MFVLLLYTACYKVLLSINQEFLTGEDSAPQGRLVISGDIFGFHN